MTKITAVFFFAPTYLIYTILIVLLSCQGLLAQIDGVIDDPGDILFVALNSEESGSEDGFSFVAMDDIPNGVSIVFSDEEYTNGGGFGSGEGDVTWMNNTGSSIPRGTVISITDSNDDAVGIMASIGVASESDSGYNPSTTEQIYAFIGSRAAPTFLTFISVGGGGGTHDIPTALTDGLNAITLQVLGNPPIWIYNGPTTCSGTLASCQMEIYNESNWITSIDDNGLAFPSDVPGNFSGTLFGGCTDAAPPSITCPGAQQGVLDGSCNFTVIDYTGLATTSDDCGPVTVTQNPMVGDPLSGVGAQTVVLTATDGVGNTATCSTTLILEDDLPPSAVCQNTTIDVYGAVTLEASQVDNGSSDLCSPPVSLSVSPNMFDCGSLTVGTSPVNSVDIGVTLTVTDQSTNTSTCSATVQLRRAPLAICQDATLQVAGTEVLDPNLIYNGGGVSCNPPISLAVLPNMFDCGDLTMGTSPVNSTMVTVTLTVSDIGSNTASCSASVTLERGAPNAICQDVTVQVNNVGATTLSANDVNNGSTTCSENPITSLTVAPNSFDCLSIGMQTVTLTATNDRGSATCTATATIEEAMPMAVCQDATVQIESSGNVNLMVSDIDNGSTNTCDTEMISPSSFTCSDLGTQTVTLTVSSLNHGNSTCTASVTVEDPDAYCCQAPVAICTNLTLNLDANGSAMITASIVGTGSTADCTQASETLSLSIFDCDHVGANTVTYTITDNNGSTSSCTASITVEDNEAPTITCPPSATVGTDPGNCTAVVNYAAVIATDNCDAVIPSLDMGLASGSAFPVGTNLVSYSVIDNSGNSSTCSFNVTVSDNTPPTAVCQDRTVQLNGLGNGSIHHLTVASASTDNCPGELSYSPSSFTFYCGDIGLNTVTMTVMDVSNNSATCTAAVTVQDNMTPTISCPADFTQSVDNSCMTTVPDLTRPIGTVLAQSSNDFSNTQGQDGWFYGMYGAFNAAGFTQLPNYTGFVWNNAGAGTILDFPQLDANGGHPQFENFHWAVRRWQSDFTGQVQISGDFFDRDGSCGDGAHVRIFQNGTEVFQFLNITTASTPYSFNLNIAVGDLIDFAIDPKFDVSCDDTHFTGTITALTGPTTNDNCNMVTITQSPIAGTVASIGNNLITLTATDGSGNSTTCSVNMMVVDNILPTVSCNDFTIQLDAGGMAALMPEDFAMANDNCTASLSFNTGQTSYSCDDANQMFTVSVIATDLSGNVSLTPCSATITVSDADNPCCSAPVAMCQDATVAVNSYGLVSLSSTQVNNGSTADCGFGNPSLSVSSFNLGCSTIGDNTVTLSVFDVKGATSTCTATVTIEDNIAPAAGCQNTTIQLDGSGNGSQTAAAVESGSSDNCGAINAQSLSPNTFDCMDVGDVTVTLTVNDGNGNTGTCTATVTTEDNLVPTAGCQNTTIQLDGSGNGSQTAAAVESGSSDNCGTVNAQSLSPNAFTCSDVGVVTVTLTVNDDHGNTGTCTATVLVEDNTQPTITCPPNLTMEWPPNFNLNPVPPNTPQDPSVDLGIIGIPVIDDNCNMTSFTFQDVLIGPDPGNCPNLWVLERTWTVTDHNNNLTATCVQTITFTDTTSPTIICPPPLTLEWPPNFNINPVPPDVPQDPSIDPAITGTPVTNDNCGVANVSYQDVLIGPSPGNCPNLWVLERTWTVTDFCNLTATCVQTITFTDLTPPTIICPPPLTFEWPPNFNINPVPPNVPQDPSIDPGITGNPITNDNCGVVGVNYQDVLIGPSPNNCPNLWVLERTWTATDFCGLTAVCVQTITFTDTTPPTVVCTNFTAEIVEGVAIVMQSDVFVSSSDNCGTPSVSLGGQTVFDCDDVGSNYTVTLTATDNCNLTGTCTATVSVTDPNTYCCEGPVAMCNPLTLQLDVNGNVSASASLLGAGSTADCGLASETVNPSTFDCMDIGPNTVTYTITDIKGASSSCTAIMTVEDNIAPTAGCINTTIQLDMNGDGVQTAGAVESGSSDNCGTINIVSLNPDVFGCSDVGSNTITLTVNDGNGNTGTCTATVMVEDDIPPVATCQDATVSLDASGNGTLLGTDVDNNSTDACGIASVSVSPASFDCTDLGGNTVTLEVTDNHGNSTTCLATATVEDDIRPSISCPGNTMFSNDPGTCEATFTVPTPVANDNCGVTVLRYRWRPVDDLGDDIPGEDWSSWSTAAMQTLDIGRWKFQWQAKDDAGKQRKCDFLIDIVDNEPPLPICFNPTVEFNGEASITLLASDVWDSVSSSDNCGTVNYVSHTPTELTCDQLGQTIAVTVMVEDEAGLTSACTAMVTVGGLPCDWSSNPDGINCADGSEASFDPTTSTFTIDSEGCYDPNYYSNSDSHGFANIELCGDGEIIAQITGVSGSGYAGISMREDLSAGSKMLQLGIDGVMLSKRELRQSTNGLGFNHIFQTQGNNWLRLTRSGNQFTAQHSSDGVNWSFVIITNIVMPNCIEVGLYTENNTPTGTVTGTFENVEIKPGVFPLATPGQDLDIASSEPMEQISVYPNPTKGEAYINMLPLLGQQATIQVFNSTGQALEVIEIDEVELPTQRLDLRGYRSGLYLIQVKAPHQAIITRKLIIAN